MIRNRWRFFAWSLLGAALLVLASWPLMIWWHVSNGVPLMPAAFETRYGHSLPSALGLQRTASGPPWSMAELCLSPCADRPRLRALRRSPNARAALRARPRHRVARPAPSRMHVWA